MTRYVLGLASLPLLLFFSGATSVLAQAAPQTPPTAVGQTDASATLAALAAQMQQLQAALDAVRGQLATARQESQDLRQQLATMRADFDALRERAAAGGPAANETLANLAQEQELLSAKVSDLEQTKVESGSKYHLRLSGLVLLNVVGTRGFVDSLDVPTIALPQETGDSGGSFSAGFRQSSVGLELFGPTLGGARTTGDVKFDFFAGFPATVDGLSSSLLRLRTANIRADWTNVSIAAGQDTLFFSPRSPTSLASSAYPALASAGNLWAWTPQVYVERRVALSPASKLTLQGGILAALTGEPPASEYTRFPTAGERSRLPAGAFRISWQHGTDDRAAEIGAGGYYAKQNWGFERTISAWAATGDWNVPLGPWVAISGELYRGRAISGLGGGAVASVLFDGTPTTAESTVLPLDSAGGWAQVKLKASSRLEFNAALGREHSYVPGMTPAQQLQSAQEPSMTRNASSFINTIFQLRSNIIFSLEYRRLWTTSFTDTQHTADHVSFSSGIVF